jgi:hypothetical protein
MVVAFEIKKASKIYNKKINKKIKMAKKNIREFFR